MEFSTNFIEFNDDEARQIEGGFNPIAYLKAVGVVAGTCYAVGYVIGETVYNVTH